MAVGLTDVLAGFLAKRLEPATMASRLRRLADAIEGTAKAQPQTTKASRDPEIQEVFGYWKEVTKRPGAKLTKERRTKILARLTEGYSVDILKRAIKHVASSPFHQGDNERGKRYDDIMTALANGSRVEGYAGHVEETEDSPVAQALRRYKEREEG